MKVEGRKGDTERGWKRMKEKIGRRSMEVKKGRREKTLEDHEHFFEQDGLKVVRQREEAGLISRNGGEQGEREEDVRGKNEEKNMTGAG